MVQMLADQLVAKWEYLMVVMMAGSSAYLKVVQMVEQKVCLLAALTVDQSVSM